MGFTFWLLSPSLAALKGTGLFPLQGFGQRRWGNGPIPSINSSGNDGNGILKMTEADAAFECSLLTRHCVSLS